MKFQQKRGNKNIQQDFKKLVKSKIKVIPSSNNEWNYNDNICNHSNTLYDDKSSVTEYEFFVSWLSTPRPQEKDSYKKFPAYLLYRNSKSKAKMRGARWGCVLLSGRFYIFFFDTIMNLQWYFVINIALSCGHQFPRVFFRGSTQ